MQNLISWLRLNGRLILEVTEDDATTIEVHDGRFVLSKFVKNDRGSSKN